MVQKTDGGSQGPEGTRNPDDVFVLKPESVRSGIEQSEHQDSEPAGSRSEPVGVGEPVDESDQETGQAATWKAEVRRHWWIGAIAAGLAAAGVSCLLARRRRRDDTVDKVRRFLADHAEEPINRVRRFVADHT